MPAGPALGRVGAQRRALTTPSTARASKARWRQSRNPAFRMQRSSGKDGHPSGPDLRANHQLLCPGKLEHNHVRAGGAFVRRVLRTQTRTDDTTNAGVNDPVAALWGHRQGRTPGSFTPALVLRLRHRLP